jgi:hypothetical protein
MVLPLHTPLQSNNDGDSQHFKSVPVVKQENTTNQSWYKTTTSTTTTTYQ